MRGHLAIVIPLLFTAAGAVAPAGRADAVDSDALEVIVAIDASGSMRSVMGATQAAAREFVAAMPADVRIGLQAFADGVSLLTPPTTDRALLAQQIDSIVADGNTALYDVVVQARSAFTALAQERVLVILSDGKDEGSSATLQEAVVAARELNVEAISLSTAETDLESLRALGTVTSADDSAGVAAAFTRIASKITAVVVTSPTTLPAATTAAPTTSGLPPATAGPSATTTSVAAAVVASDSSPGSPMLLTAGAIGTFGALLVLATLAFPQRRVTRARLGIARPRTASDMGKRTVTAVEELLERRGKRADLATTLSVAGVSLNPGEFVATTALVALVIGLVMLVLTNLWVAGAALVGVCLLVRLYVVKRRAKRENAFADQLPEVLQLLTSALRSGFGLTQALESVAEEAEQPARSEFAHVLVEVRLGRNMSDAVRAVADRMRSKDLHWVVAAIEINRETGGNLSEILDRVGTTIRDRQRMARHVRTLTAEGRMSARILTALPLGLLLWQWRVNPDDFDLLTHGAGLAALILAGILLVLGVAWVRRITTSVTL